MKTYVYQWDYRGASSTGVVLADTPVKAGQKVYEAYGGSSGEAVIYGPVKSDQIVILADDDYIGRPLDIVKDVLLPECGFYNAGGWHPESR